MTDSTFNQSLDRLKESFLWAAAQGGNTEDCDSLLEIGADVNWKHTDGDTPLLAACRRGHTETVETLIVHGADVDSAGADKLTPLHICCLRGDYSTLNVILAANPSLTVLTKDGKTALQLAEAKGYEDICSRMTQHISSSRGNSSNALRRQPSQESSSRRGSGRSNRVEPRQLPHAAALRLNRDVADELDPTDTSSLALDVTVMETKSDNSLVPLGRNRSSQPLPSITPTAGSTVGADSPRTQDAPRPSAGTQSGSTSSSRSLSAQDSQCGDRDDPIQSDKKKSKTVLPSSLPAHAPSIPPRTTLSSSSSYAIMGQHITPGHDEASIALRKQLDIEHKEKKMLEGRVRILEDEVQELSSLNATITDQLEDMHSENNDLTAQLAVLSGSTIDKFCTLKECENLEKKLKDILKKVEDKKAIILAKELDNQKEQRLCVICQEGEKSVVLFPCRHMCLCQECSARDDLEQCPLCRRPIVQRISVFS